MRFTEYKRCSSKVHKEMPCFLLFVLVVFEILVKNNIKL